MYNDYELLYLAQENNEDAVNELRKKYNMYNQEYCGCVYSYLKWKEKLNG